MEPSETVARPASVELLAQLRLVPNQLTAVRLLLIPVLWWCALTGHALAVGVGLALAFLTDVGDGFLARRLGLGSAFGARFDSIADGLIGPSVLVWLLLLKPGVVLDHWVLFATWIGLTYASMAVGLARFHRFANLHLYSSKVAAIAQYAFIVDAFVTSAYSPALLYLAAGLGIASSTETLVLQLALDRVDEHQGSIFLVAARRLSGR
jgi:phosphatidylglycerophosphate synthase